MLFLNAQKIPTYNSQYIAHYAQVEPTIKLTKTDMRHKETWLHYRVVINLVLPVLRFESRHQLLDQFTIYYIPGVMIKANLLVLNSCLQLHVCPKILKIMPVDAYNASIILKCLHTPIMLKIMPA